MNNWSKTWGSPWSPLEFVKQAVKAGHPSQLDACLPMRLKLLSQKFRVVPVLERCRHRIQKTKFWMDRMAVLKSQEKILKASMHEDVRLVLADKNILLWKEMLQSINYEDMGVIEEFASGTALVGSALQLDCGLQKSHQRQCQSVNFTILPDERDCKVSKQSQWIMPWWRRCGSKLWLRYSLVS